LNCFVYFNSNENEDLLHLNVNNHRISSKSLMSLIPSAFNNNIDYQSTSNLDINAALTASTVSASNNNKELLTATEFLKEIEMSQKKYLYILTFLFPIFLYSKFQIKKKSDNDEISTIQGIAQRISSKSLLSLIPSTIGNSETPSTLLSPNSSNVYDEILLQQSTPVKNQLDSHKAFSKSKKLGQILKLASVRGAKVNS
jgi:hypothetical protein